MRFIQTLTDVGCRHHLIHKLQNGERQTVTTKAKFGCSACMSLCSNTATGDAPAAASTMSLQMMDIQASSVMQSQPLNCIQATAATH